MKRAVTVFEYEGLRTYAERVVILRVLISRVSEVTGTIIEIKYVYMFRVEACYILSLFADCCS